MQTPAMTIANSAVWMTVDEQHASMMLNVELLGADAQLEFLDGGCSTLMIVNMRRCFSRVSQ